MVMSRYLLDSNAVTAFIARREPFTSDVKETKLQSHPTEMVATGIEPVTRAV
jgi:hypothetical protein